MTAELVVVTPVFLAFLAAFLTGGQVVLARQQVDEAARGAAEAAVSEPTAQLAAGAAAQAARADLQGALPACRDILVGTDLSRFFAGGSVSVRVSCSMPIPGLPFASLRPTIEVSSSATSIVEPYRVVGP